MPTPEAPARWLRRLADRLGDGRPAVPLDAIPSPFFLVDAAGDVVAANAAAGAFIGGDPDTLVGLDAAEALFSLDHRGAFREHLAEPPAEAVALTARDADGAEVPVEITLRPAADGRVGVALRDLRPERATEADRDAAEGRVRMLRTIVDALPGPVEAVDKTGRVAFRNRASFDAVADGMSARRLAPEAWRAAQAVLASGGVAVEDEPVGGRVLRRTRVPVCDASGEVAGVVAIARDVTAETSHAAALAAEKATAEAGKAAAEAEKATAEAAARANADFLATTSHEIRTLMSGVTGMTALLRDTALDAEQRECVDTIQSSGDALLTIVNDVLDLSKMDAGRLELEDRPFRVRGLVGEAVRMVSQQAAAKGLTLAADVAEAAPDAVHGDPLRVKQVLLNLLSNAVKFTDAGSVRVEVEAARGPEGPELAVAVRDTGIGIAPDRLAAVFEPFAQAGASTARTHGGTGLGLAICRRLVERMGGTLAAEAAPGGGTVFRFTVPVRQTVDAGPEAAEFSLPPDSLLVDVPLAEIRAAVTAKAPEATEAEAPEPAEPEAAEAAEPGPPPLIDIPIGAGDGAAAPPPEPAATPPPERAKVLSMDGILPSARVLLAEDNPLVQKVTKMTLLRLGYRPHVVPDGISAVSAVREQPYDVVLMDLMMPRMDGLTATRQIRRDCGRHPMPAIVALTANAMRGDRERCLDAGCDDYLAKPVQPQVLAATIERALRAREEALDPTAEPG